MKMAEHSHQIQLPEPILQCLVHDLAVDDAVAAVGVGELRGNPLDGVDHLLQRRITDAVGRQMVAVGIGKLRQIVQLLVGEQQQALVSGSL